VDAGRPDDSGDGLTWATAKKTVNGAKVVAGNGYCLQLAPGSYGGPVDLSGMTDLLIRGSPGAHLSCGNGGAYAVALGDRTTVEGLRLSKTDSGGASFYAVLIHPARDVTLRDCWIEGDEGGVKIINSALIRMERCAVKAASCGILYSNQEGACQYDYSVRNIIIDGCQVAVQGAGTWGADGIRIDGAVGLVRNTHVYLNSSMEDGDRGTAIGADLPPGAVALTARSIVVDACTIVAASETLPEVVGIRTVGTQLIVRGSTLRTLADQAGENTAYDMAAVDGGIIIASGCHVDGDKTTGDIFSDLDLGSINVDSTGGQLTLAKALEVIAARCVGNLAYDADTGEVTFYGRDGQTPVATVTLTGGGNRTDSSVP
jgi:hypothetical protein